MQAKEQIGFPGTVSLQQHFFSLSWDSPDDCRSGVQSSHFLNRPEAQIWGTAAWQAL